MEERREGGEKGKGVFARNFKRTIRERENVGKEKGKRGRKVVQ